MVLRYTLATWAVLTVGLAVFCNGQNHHIMIKKGEICSEPKYLGLPVYFEKPVFQMTAQSGSLTMSGTIVVTKVIDGVTMEVEVGRCITEEVRSCTKLLAVNCSNACGLISQKNKIWSTIFSNIKDLPQKCPIPIGRYEMRNAFIDFKKGLTDQTLTPGYWMGKMVFYDKDGPFLCLWGLGSTKRTRNRRPQM